MTHSRTSNKMLAVALFCACAAAISVFFSFSPRHASAQGGAVTAEMLMAAGYKDVTLQPPIPGRFAPPNYYFWVKESPNDTIDLSQGDPDNLVGVLVVPFTDKSWVYNNGQPQFFTYGARTQIRTSSKGYYIVVTGPDKAKVVKLADMIVANPEPLARNYR